MQKTLAELGQIMIDSHGTVVVEDVYGTTDPTLVGRHALDYGDINGDGTTN